MSQSTNTHTQQAQEENRSAVILFAIVILFLVCHLPRNFLNLHEALTFAQKKEDYLNGCSGMPMWILVIGLLSHFLLACNSAFNFLLYCAMSKVFREELCIVCKSCQMSCKHCAGVRVQDLDSAPSRRRSLTSHGTRYITTSNESFELTHLNRISHEIV